MRYTVNLDPDRRETSLADVWTRTPPDRQAVTAASHRIERRVCASTHHGSASAEDFYGDRLHRRCAAGRDSSPCTRTTYEWICSKFDTCSLRGLSDNARLEINEPMLEINNLHARVDDKEILRGVNLTVNAGEVHAIMGPNGSGKSTLAGVLAGRDAYEVTEGEVLFEGKDLLDMDPEERAREGIFLAFQYPVEIPGVSNTYFLRAAVNAIRKHRGQPELDAVDVPQAGQARR